MSWILTDIIPSSLDPLPASIMTKCCHALLPMLRRITNLSLAMGEMPEDLKCAMLRLLLKKPTADHKVFANFRPVSNLKVPITPKNFFGPMKSLYCTEQNAANIFLFG